MRSLEPFCNCNSCSRVYSSRVTERAASPDAPDLAAGGIALGEAPGEERVNRIISAELGPTGDLLNRVRRAEEDRELARHGGEDLGAAVRADIERATSLLEAGLGSFAGWRSA